MKVESIAECPPWSILQYFWPALSHNQSWKIFWSSFWVAAKDRFYCIMNHDISHKWSITLRIAILILMKPGGIAIFKLVNYWKRKAVSHAIEVLPFSTRGLTQNSGHWSRANNRLQCYLMSWKSWSDFEILNMHVHLNTVLCLGQDIWETQVSLYLNFRGTFTNSGGHTKYFKFLPVKLNSYPEISVHFLFKFELDVRVLAREEM